ncbi:MAG: hypothetical protein HYW49_07075 [Deltaproteobacteria bacterium]|nr:hypothetical protein [Deltaproteobacteria bacterium]
MSEEPRQLGDRAEPTALAFGFFAGLCFFYVAYALLLQWHWNMMDEVSFIAGRASMDASPRGLVRVAEEYFTIGRFYPLGATAKYAAFAWLPPDVLAHRAWRFVVVAVLVVVFVRGIGFRAFAARAAAYFAAVLWFCAFCFRDGLDLLSISEIHGCVYGFLAVAIALGGAAMTPRRLTAALFLVALAALTKEPFVAYFMVIAGLAWLRMPGKTRAFGAGAALLLGGAWIVALMSLRHGYSSGFGSSISMRSFTALPWAAFRNYHLLWILVAAAFAARKARVTLMTLVWLAGFFGYGGIVSLWGVTDTFLYLHIPAVPLLALAVASMLEPLLRHPSRAWTFAVAACLAVLSAQTVRGAFRSYVLNHEHDGVSQVMAMYKSGAHGRLWTNCDEPAATLVTNAKLMHGKAIEGVRENGTMYRLQLFARQEPPRAGDWIVYSSRCEPYDLSSMNLKAVFEGDFYAVFSVE